MGAQGFSTVNFGAFPGVSDVELVVTGQAGINSGTSSVEAWVYPTATADHSVGEHLVEQLKAVAHSIVTGTGFTISVFHVNPLSEPLESAGAGGGGNASTVSRTIGNGALERGGRGTLVYGQWTIGWVWN